ncbi:HET-domain-containing protein [Xylaria sp. FL0043]|nr:HET-domain-containing protein [Xylaria sp. FL0043]
MASSGKCYEYQPLPADSSIRLLRILPSAGNTITCSIKVFDISEAPCYYALSYTWGDPLDQRLSSPNNYRIVTNDLNKHIHLEDGSEIRVTENLLDALAELGSRLASYACSVENQPYWWIDAICIHQGNMEEKSAQVAMMGQIYKQAKRVVIWLGREDEHTDGAVKVLCGLASLKAESKKSLVSDQNWSSDGHSAGGELIKASGLLGLHDVDYQDWLDYAAFLQRRWFSRTWVLQERFFAAETEILCGKRSISWADISRSSDLLMYTRMNILLKAYVDYTLSGVAYNTSSAVQQLPNNRLDNQQIFNLLRKDNARKPRLDELLYWTKTFDATDERDHIYGIKDVWEKDMRISGTGPNIQTDYRRETSEVYSAATILAIRESQDLSILGLVEDPISRNRKDLATWVPDYSSGPLMYPLLSTWEQPATSAWCASRGLAFHVPEVERNSQLAVDGFELDEIMQIGPSYIEVMDHFQLDSLLQLLSNYPCNEYPTHEACYDAFARSLIKNTYHEQPATPEACQAFSAFIMKRVQEFEQHVANLARRRRTDEARDFTKKLDNLKHTLDLLASQFNEQNVIPSALETSCLISIAEDEGSADEQVLEDRRKGMEESFRIAYLGRRMFLTDRGFFGITSESVRIGDKVWILAGSRTPFVLRIIEQSKSNVVGEAYVHGLMQGEAVVRNAMTKRIFLS